MTDKEQGKIEEKLEEKGVPGWVKVAGALVTILATIAGILFGVQQIIQSNRNFQVQMANEERATQDRRREEDRKFDKEMQVMKDQADKDKQTLLAQNTAREAELERTEADKRAAEAKIAEAGQKQAEAAAQQAQADLDKIDRQNKRDEAATKKKEETLLRTQEADHFRVLQTSIVKLRLMPSDVTDFETLGVITEGLNAEETLKHAALDALDARLELFPSRAEVEFIFNALHDAGYSEVMDIAVRSNRRAWKVLEGAIDNDFDEAYRKQEMSYFSAVGPKPGLREILESAMLLVRGKVGMVLRGRSSRTLANDFEVSLLKYLDDLGDPIFRSNKVSPESSGTPSLDSVVGMLLASRLTIERLLPMVPEDEDVNLDDCFLPNFAPEKSTRSSLISLRRSYFAGADFRALEVPLGSHPSPNPSHLVLVTQLPRSLSGFLARSNGFDIKYLQEHDEFRISPHTEVKVLIPGDE